MTLYIDDLVPVSSARLRATKAIRPDMSQIALAHEGVEETVGLAHIKLNDGGGYSYFLCPHCAKQRIKLRAYEGRLWCWDCLRKKLRFRAGGGYRTGVDRRLRVEKLAALLNGPSPRFKPTEPIVGRKRVELRLRREMLKLRAETLGIKA